MNMIMMISLRNLFRQKRRNILLGIAIAVGIMILVIANSFSRGISDIIFNKIAAYVAGHVQISFNEKGQMYRTIFRDKDRILPIVQKNVEGLRSLDEAIGVFSRAIGNGKADNVVIVGIDLEQKVDEKLQKEYEESFKMIEGDFNNLKKKDIENPVIISEEKAKYLNVRLNDSIRVRFTNMNGQNQATKLSVIGIMKNDNIFMNGVLFLDVRNVKKLMGFRPYETSSLNLVIWDAKKNAVAVADKLHSLLKPGLAVIYADVKYKNKFANATVLGYKSDNESIKTLKDQIKIKIPLSFTLIKGAVMKEEDFGTKSVFISETLAKKLGVKSGDIFEIAYKNKFEGKGTTVKYTLKSIIEFNNKNLADKNIIFLNEEKFYDTYYDNLPEDYKKIKDVVLPEENSGLYPILATEWILLDRSSTTDELQKKMKDMSKKKWKGTVVDVRSMYESASDVLKLESALNLITFNAVMILFFIILIGVINTLRMTIRERTREIGTVRAIGMQKNDVRNSFIYEAFFLALFASIAGIIIAFILMHILSAFTINMPDNPLSILLVNGHLYFMPSFLSIILNTLLILVIVVVTAYFPARRAANMSPTTALRHYE
ncbi:MAG: FtsX-like permease family protein [Candidatus Firestonebacteria bacterium]